MVCTRRVWLFAPVGSLFALDVALTLLGQDPDYWSGALHTANEANPIARPLLATNPWLFAGLAVLWASVLAAVIVAWESRWSNLLAILVAFGHALGGSSWLLRTGDWGFALAGGYLVLAAQFCFWCWKKGTVQP